MKMRYLGLFALAPLAAQCQPACTPTPPPPVETTTTITTSTTSTTTTTTAAPVAPYTFTLSCNPLQGTFTAGPREIVVQGGFGFGPTPQTVIPAGESETLPWQAIGGTTAYIPTEEASFGVLDTATSEVLGEETFVLAEECPDGWTSPVDDGPAVFEVRNDINADCTVVSWTNTGNRDLLVEYLAEDGFTVTDVDLLEPGETLAFTFDENGDVPANFQVRVTEDGTWLGGFAIREGELTGVGPTNRIMYGSVYEACLA
jgi:hypothetical protein